MPVERAGGSLTTSKKLVAETGLFPSWACRVYRPVGSHWPALSVRGMRTVRRQVALRGKSMETEVPSAASSVATADSEFQSSVPSESRRAKLKRRLAAPELG